jgi:hypothetical protein
VSAEQKPSVSHKPPKPVEREPSRPTTYVKAKVKSGKKFYNFLYYARIMDINNLYLLTIKLATFLFATYFREKTLAMLGNALLLLKSRSGLLMI